MSLAAVALFAQLAVPLQPAPPVLAFPEPGLDDPAAYQGYQTRFHRDAARNTVQLYLDGREGRVVALWADADNASAGFSARTPDGRPAPLRWGAADARIAGSGARRTLAWELVADVPEVRLGHLLLGSMRVERDFQAWGRHRAPYDTAAFVLDEHARLLAALERLDPATRARHLARLDARSVAELRARLQPTVALRRGDTLAIAEVRQPALDGRDTLTLDVLVDPRRVALERADGALRLRARSGSTVPFTVRIGTSAEPLTPLARTEIFTPDFLAFLDSARAAGAAAPAGDSAAIRARWLERQVRGVELLASREKLMAGLPTYATYFGRDMLVTALMMRPVWRDEMSAFVVAAMLRKLSPTGQVSHEEALGGQAVREASAEYATLVDESLAARRGGRAAEADGLLARAERVLADARRVRENYHMIDDELQLPVLAARWLGDAQVPAAERRAFLLERGADGEPRLAALMRELALVARMTAPYAAEPVAANLIPFAARDSVRWAATSWRDSNAGYANGRYAMDVNAVWAPHALAALDRIVRTTRELGLPLDSLAGAMPELAPGTPLGEWLREPAALAAATDAWRGAARHFLVRLSPAEVQAQVAERLAAMPPAERAHWAREVERTGAAADSLVFLALALDADARPLGVANTDPATRLFLGEPGAAGTPPDAATRAAVLRDARLFVRPYPVGLLVPQVGPVVANDAYAPPRVWADFAADPYHGPKVVWGREVNLFLLGAAERIAAAGAGDAAYTAELREAVERVQRAVEASGFQSELWSYEVRDGRVVPVRYGTGADVQLWSTTDLAVQYVLSRLGL